MTKIFVERKLIALVGIGVLILIILNVILLFMTAEGKIFNHNGGFVSVREPVQLTSVNSLRLNNYNLCKPLLLINLPEDIAKFKSLKEKAEQFIQQEVAAKKLTTASVYLKTLKNGSWMAINPDEKYFPASMYKEAVLIAFLKTAQETPGLLNQVVKFTTPQVGQRDVRNVGEYLEVGKNYTYKELLRRMIVLSDNESANLIVQKMGVPQMQKLADELNIPGEQGSVGLQVNVSDMSKLLRVLYGSTYLTPENSEFALELLAQSRYEDGIAKFLSKDIQIAHKFGERNLLSDPQLHETAIIYFQGNPVLLTIMTKGPDYNLLSNEIAELSKLILEDVSQMN